MTSFEEEREAQARWELREGGDGPSIFDKLLEAEFISEDRQQGLINSRLQQIARFAATRVPYYQTLFAKLGLPSDAIRDTESLRKLPVLTREDLLRHAEALKARELPRGDRLHAVYSSSGTTGLPTTVVMTERASAMFTILTQRMYRWFRFDPKGVVASIRLPQHLAPRADGQLLANRVTQRSPRWRYVGQVFKTGPSIAFSRSNTLPDQIEWLYAEHPDYLVTYSGLLEEHAFAALDYPPVESLQSVLSIATQLTAQMRARVEQCFQLPVHENYGLNEVGVVAGRCEAGRYHVHAEHCWVEIVDDDGNPAPPQSRGRVLVTSLQNAAMPLLRYDTEDTALVLDGPCSCGRILPSFGAIGGRIRRWAGLPFGTRPRFALLLTTIRSMPVEVLRDLRRFQIHQNLDESFLVRVVENQPLPEIFTTRLQAAWRSEFGCDEPPPAIVAVDRIEALGSGKSTDFSSDYRPATVCSPQPGPVPD